LTDYYLARAMSQGTSIPYDSQAYYQNLYMEAVLQKHGVTRADFDSSMVYYYTRADRYEEICKHVADRLEEQALVMGATEGEIGKYASLNATGDTANVWADRTLMTLMPVPPYNRWDFSLEVDSTYQRGDSFLMQFMSDYLFQDGAKSGLVYLAVTYDNDTIVTRNVRFSASGLSQLHFPALEDRDIKTIRGFFFLGDTNDRSTTTRLLFLSNVQLIRFHKQKKTDEEKQATDSLQPAGPAGREIDIDTDGGRDSVGGSQPVLPVDSGVILHRMGKRRLMSPTR
jgi:hypothetical protein